MHWIEEHIEVKKDKLHRIQAIMRWIELDELYMLVPLLLVGSSLNELALNSTKS